MKKRVKKNIWLLFWTFVVMVIGTVILKYIPMKIFGGGIQFDASLHIIVAAFVLYFIYFFIDENIKWRVPYFIFSSAILVIIAVQRIFAGKHNEIGVLLGILVSVLAIFIPRWEVMKNKLKF